jgi:hypothetical protein
MDTGPDWETRATPLVPAIDTSALGAVRLSELADVTTISFCVEVTLTDAPTTSTEPFRAVSWTSPADDASVAPASPLTVAEAAAEMLIF